MEPWAPALTLRVRGGRCRLALCRLTHGEGITLQEAADDLLARVVALAAAVRYGGLPYCSALRPPDGDVMRFLHDVAGLSGERDELRRYVLCGT